MFTVHPPNHVQCLHVQTSFLTPSIPGFSFSHHPAVRVWFGFFGPHRQWVWPQPRVIAQVNYSLGSYKCHDRTDPERQSSWSPYTHVWWKREKTLIGPGRQNPPRRCKREKCWESIDPAYASGIGPSLARTRRSRTMRRTGTTRDRNG